VPARNSWPSARQLARALAEGGTGRRGGQGVAASRQGNSRGWGWDASGRATARLRTRYSLWEGLTLRVSGGFGLGCEDLLPCFRRKTGAAAPTAPLYPSLAGGVVVLSYAILLVVDGVRHIN
jgi:hypothetical protein